MTRDGCKTGARNALRIGTRGSALALLQATWVGGQIQQRFPRTRVSYVKIKTKGDKIVDSQLATVGGKGLFVKEIEEALLAKRVDIAVHSVKDMPARLPDGLQITAFPIREDPRDVLLSPPGSSLFTLPAGARIGTSSLRRRALLLRCRKDFRVVPLRGNLDTRVRKMENQSLHGVILAAAGIRRMGMESRITEALPPETFIPAIGQGALGVETRADDQAVISMVRALDHPVTRMCVQAERTFLARLNGGCQVPIGGYARIERKRIILVGMVCGLDGEPMVQNCAGGAPADSEEIGMRLADQVLSQGAEEILESLYRGFSKREEV